MYPRRAQGLSISTLILVTLGILVLAISIFFFTDLVSNGRNTINNCENLGGSCQPSCDDPGLSHNSLGDRSCEEPNRCCVSR